ncbi:MAG: 4-hydroxy-tetrahydrodipicolinate reductase [Microbacteriaceae bacterium]|nr:4-hydroxy-tetrahydrodipicolinate reductase [Microbacteriaceae bacterium]
MTTVAVVGATGRLGTQIVRVVESMDGFEIVARLNSQSDLSEMDRADLVIDVTRHDVSIAVVDRAVSNGQRVLVGTSGWSSAAIEAKSLPSTANVVFIPNFSVGSTVATHVSALVARYIPNARIDETHHVNKVDAPSGTSTHTAEAIAAARAATPNQPAKPGDHIVAGVPITSHRLPDAIAEQLVTFTGNGETVTIGHETTSRDSYDSGIAAAILFTATTAGVTVGLDRVLGIR